MEKRKMMFSLISVFILIIGIGCKKENKSDNELERALNIQHQKMLKEQEKMRSEENKKLDKSSIISKEESTKIESREKEPYVFVKKWDKKTLALNESFVPRAMVFDSKGFIYILTLGLIKKFSSDGKFILEWGKKKEFLWGYRMAIDSQDNIYLTDPLRNTIYKFTSSGELIRTWGKPGSGNGEFKEPCGIAVDSKDNLYITDRFNSRVQKFNLDGKFISTWGKLGRTEPGEFREPQDIAIDTKSFVYVADTWNDRIQKFDEEGNFVAMWGKHGEGDGEFRGAMAIAIGSKDVVYAVDADNFRIQMFTSDGKYLAKWGTRGRWNEEGKFGMLSDIAIDKEGLIYICDIEKYCIHIFKKRGE